MNNFRFDVPFRTKAGWPARLIGVLNRTAYPYVVAIFNPAFQAEELLCFAEDGRQPVRTVAADGEVLESAIVDDGPMSLVNISDDEYFAITQETVVDAAILPMVNFPPNSNPFHHDAMNMGTLLVGGWTIMHTGYGSQPLRGFYMNHSVTGQNIKVLLSPKLKPLTTGE